jgi:dephospho-CoA kinase
MLLSKANRLFADTEAQGRMTAKPIIGLVGGIGSGKSVVARLLGELGASVMSSDQLNREELAAPEVLAQLREWWGDKVIDARGQADRDVIRAIVGQDESWRRRLEALLHPRIAARREAMMVELRKDARTRAIVWDSPLLFETGLAERCDYIVFVDSCPRARLDRVVRDRHWTKEDLERFEKAQKPLDIKRELADYIVDNNSDIDAVRRQVEGVFSRILTAAQAACG